MDRPLFQPLTYDLDTLLFCSEKQANNVLQELESGFDQVVAVCVSSNDDPERAHTALWAANKMVADAERIDLPVFVDTRELKDLNTLDLSSFAGAVCDENHVKFLTKTLASDATIIVDAGISRHAAMLGAEAGAHAVLFRNKPGQQAQDIYAQDDEGPQDVASLYMWWEQIMEPPAILHIDSLDSEPSWMKHVEFIATQVTLA